mmetsp:Transcript_12542/g.18943  ORF Transcript_12542/g.18943 Transcript_12542/m.18943 type:complete len:123 (-) Transcript_12542:980-1348(-)
MDTAVARQAMIRPMGMTREGNGETVATFSRPYNNVRVSYHVPVMASAVTAQNSAVSALRAGLALTARTESVPRGLPGLQDPQRKTTLHMCSNMWNAVIWVYATVSQAHVFAWMDSPEHHATD